MVSFEQIKKKNVIKYLDLIYKQTILKKDYYL